MGEGMKAIYASYLLYSFLPTHKNIEKAKSIGDVLRFVLRLNIIGQPEDEAEKVIKWLSNWEK